MDLDSGDSSRQITKTNLLVDDQVNRVDAEASQLDAVLLDAAHRCHWFTCEKATG